MHKLNIGILIVLILKLWLFRKIVYDGNQLINTVQSELPLILLVVIIAIILLKNKLHYGLIILNITISLFLLGIVMFYSYYGFIPTYTALQNANQLGDVKASILELFQWRYCLFLMDIPLFLLLMFFVNKQTITLNHKTIVVCTIISIILFGSNIIIAQAKYNDIDRSDIMGVFAYQAYAYVTDSIEENQKDNAIANETYDNIYFIDSIKKLKGLTDISNEFNGIASGKNLIVIQFEALQSFPLNLTIDGQEITPNLNKLVDDGIYFPNTFQQIGSGNTSDAEFILNTSIYPVGHTAMSTELVGANVPSLPRILKEDGYITSTFHTNDVEFWDRDEMYQSLGFDSVYDDTYFGKKDFIAFGASDEVLYDKTLRVIEGNRKQGKFYAHIVTMSSHHPFELPSKKVGINLPKDLQDTNLGRYFTSINYADKALGEFISKLEDKGIKEESLIVVYGDHFGFRFNDDEAEREQNLFKKYVGYDYHVIDKFKVPLIINLHNEFLDNTVNMQTAGHVDIMPTILNLMGETVEDKVLFGQDLLNNEENLIGMRYYSPEGTYITNTTFYTPKEKQEVDNLNRAPTGQDFKMNEQQIIKLLQLSDEYVRFLKYKTD